MTEKESFIQVITSYKEDTTMAKETKKQLLVNIYEELKASTMNEKDLIEIKKMVMEEIKATINTNPIKNYEEKTERIKKVYGEEKLVTSNQKQQHIENVIVTTDDYYELMSDEQQEKLNAKRQEEIERNYSEVARRGSETSEYRWGGSATSGGNGTIEWEGKKYTQEEFKQLMIEKKAAREQAQGKKSTSKYEKP
jgi:hypothetical protein